MINVRTRGAFASIAEMRATVFANRDRDVSGVGRGSRRSARHFAELTGERPVDCALPLGRGQKRRVLRVGERQGGI